MGRPPPSIMDDTALEKAMATARHLLSDIETAFALRADPHTWRSKARWALKDKKLLEQLYERLQTVETTLQGIVSMEQLYVRHGVPKKIWLSRGLFSL